MSRPTDKPMARASAHLAAGRFAEAAGAFRAVLHIDRNEYRAHLGIADATAARGDRDGAIAGLIENAQSYNEDANPEAALALYGRVLVLDPNRIDVHLDIAFAESALGRHDDAVARVEGLAEAYLRGGRSDEAEELFRFAATWEVEAPEPTPEPMPVPAAMAEPPHPAYGTPPAGIPVAAEPSPEPTPEPAPTTSPSPAAAPEPAMAAPQWADGSPPDQWRLPLGTAPQHFSAQPATEAAARENTMPFYVARPGESTGEVPRLPATDMPSSRATLVPLGPPTPQPEPMDRTMVSPLGDGHTWSPPHLPTPSGPSAEGHPTLIGQGAPAEEMEDLPTGPQTVVPTGPTTEIPDGTPVELPPSQTPTGPQAPVAAQIGRAHV